MLMKKIALCLMILLLAGNVWANFKTGKNKKKRKSKTTQTVAPPLNMTGIKSIAMGRGACYGHCPVYTIEIFENGLVRYTGRSDVAYIGVYETKINPNDAIKTITQFASYRPDTCQPSYKSLISDLPSIYYLISYRDSVKHIYNANYGAEFLKEMAPGFDKYNNVDKTWIKSKTDVKK